MPKEKAYNPVQAQRKADKAKAIKKGMSDISGLTTSRSPPNQRIPQARQNSKQSATRNSPSVTLIAFRSR